MDTMYHRFFFFASLHLHVFRRQHRVQTRNSSAASPYLRYSKRCSLSPIRHRFILRAVFFSLPPPPEEQSPQRNVTQDETFLQSLILIIHAEKRRVGGWAGWLGGGWWVVEGGESRDAEVAAI